MAEAALATPPAAATPTPAAAPAAPTSATPPASAPAPVSASPQAPAAAPVAPKAPTNLLGDEAPKEGEKPAEAKPAEAAPEIKAYDALKIPDGITVDEPSLTEFKTIAAEAKLTPEAAQKMVDLQAKLTTQTSEAIYGLWAKTQETWQGEVMADKELGGHNWPSVKKGIEDGLKTMLMNGSNTPEATAAAGKLYADLMGALKYTGGANNPAIIRALHALTRPHSEGGPVTGSTPKTGAKSLAERFYPTPPKEQ